MAESVLTVPDEGQDVVGALHRGIADHVARTGSRPDKIVVTGRQMQSIAEYVLLLLGPGAARLYAPSPGKLFGIPLEMADG